MNNTYKYYGRTSGVEIWEIYRCPADDLPLFEQPLFAIQMANNKHAWLTVDNIQGLWEENLTGWFDEDNLLSAEKAKTILFSWNLLLD